MQRILLALAGGLLMPTLLAQDMIHYKVETACGTEVVNYANGAAAIPSTGLLDLGGNVTPWVPGRFAGSALSGTNNTTADYTRVRTGWMNPNYTGDLTLAFFMKQRVSPGTTLSYLWGGAGSLRMFTNGIANQGLYQRVIVASGGVGNRDLHLMTDVQTPAATGWVHIALVIDTAAATATWYINGNVDSVVNGVGGAQITETGEVCVGMHSTTSNSSAYDLDEFLLSQRAYTASEILALSLAPPAGDGGYDAAIASQCGNLTLDSTGGAPALGNGSYNLRLTSTAQGLYALLFGTGRCTAFSGVYTLPLDAGMLHPLASGCFLLTDTNLGQGSGILAGSVTRPLPIPNRNALLGYNAYCQALLLDSATSTMHASNGWALGLGF